MTEHGGSNPADEPDSLESRVSAIEGDLARVRYQANLAAADAAAARILAAGADHDVSEVRAELRAHSRAIGALRETQRDMQLTIRGLDQRVTVEFAAVRSEMATGFNTVGAGMAHLTTMLETLIDRG